jgi:hypothetical protein
MGTENRMNTSKTKMTTGIPGAINNLGSTEQGNQSALTVQPLSAVPIGANWNLISRTLIPVISETRAQLTLIVHPKRAQR